MIVLAVVVALLLVERTVAQRDWARERKSLIAAVMARHPGDYVAMTAEPRPRKPAEPVPPTIGAGG